MAGKCRDGVDLPDHGPCPECGANDWENCRGKHFNEMMRITAEKEAERAAKREPPLERYRDRRTNP